jgi:hypothetical protein
LANFRVTGKNREIARICPHSADSAIKIGRSKSPDKDPTSPHLALTVANIAEAVAAN